MKLKYLWLLLPFLLLMSCEFDDSSYRYNLGADFIDDESWVVMIDTLTVNTYTTVTDSVVTSREDRLIAGRFENKLGVVTTAEAYFRLDPCEIIELHRTARFDSACFILYPDGYDFGDTTTVCELAIHSLTEDITVEKNSEYIYNTYQYDYDPIPLATFKVDLMNAGSRFDDYPNDSIAIRLPDEYGKQFFTMLEDYIYDRDSIIDDNDIFKTTYKGYTIRPANDASSFIVGFNAVVDTAVTPKLRVYYHDINASVDPLFFDYPLEDFENYTGGHYEAGEYVEGKFNLSDGNDANSYVSSCITNDYRNSVFKGIDDGINISEKKMSSKLTNGYTMIQGGVNVRTRIELPSIDELHFLGKGAVVKALLYFEPMSGSYQYEYQLPTSFQMFLVDKKNRMYGQMLDFDQSTPITSTLLYDNDIQTQTRYVVDITRYFRDEFLDDGDPYYSLIMSFPQSKMGSAVDQLIIGDQDNKDNELELVLYMSYYKTNE